MTLRFYTDTHIPKQVALQLRQRGITVIRCEEVGLADASDVTHLEYAAQHRLSLITKDEDFLVLHRQWTRDRRQHAGIFFCRKRFVPAIGEIVTTCAEYHALIETGAGIDEDVHNQVVFV